MLSYLQTALVIAGCVLAVLCALWLVDRRFESSARRRANGVNGWQLSILGTVYAVSLGFMLSDAWLAYQTASADVRQEAEAAASLYRVASALPSPCAESFRAAVTSYASAVIDVEWPSMAKGSPFWLGERPLAMLWENATTCNSTELSFLDRQQLIGAVNRLQGNRTARINDYEGRLPNLMWAVLLVGGCSVVVASCLLANERRSIHRFHVLSLTILISLTLLAIADLDRPFQGATHVPAASFQSVLR